MRKVESLNALTSQRSQSGRRRSARPPTPKPSAPAQLEEEDLEIAELDYNISDVDQDLPDLIDKARQYWKAGCNEASKKCYDEAIMIVEELASDNKTDAISRVRWLYHERESCGRLYTKLDSTTPKIFHNINLNELLKAILGVKQSELKPALLAGGEDQTKRDAALLAAEEPKLLLRKKSLTSADLLHAAVDLEGVPDDRRDALIAKFKIEIARATRLPWKGRVRRGGELAELNAPRYLKRVHAADIQPDGSFSTDVIREIDPHLMKAVEVYISERHRRPGPLDLGDAAGLKPILRRSARRGRGPKSQTAETPTP